MNAIVVTSLPPSEISVENDTIGELSKPSYNSAKQNCNPISTIPIPSGPRNMGNIPKKPMRPLTAYHIFFQVEREYIIQNLPDATEGTKASSNKYFLEDMPDRYKAIKLSPDWYFGPGKRPKRKHRKAHGKIGFMELSRIIASRWAELDTIDPEVKAFVQKLAKQELNEYIVDMKKYKELTRAFNPVVSPNSSGASPSSSPEPAASQVKTPNPSKKRTSRPDRKQPITPTSMEGHFQPAPIDLSNEIEYFISRIDSDARQLVPSMQASTFARPRQERRNSLLTFLEPLFDTVELEQDIVIQQPSKYQRRNSPSTVAVDICDDEIIRMWKENNNL